MLAAISRSTRPVRAAMAVVVLFAAGELASAQTRTWTGNGSTLAWGDSGNWSGNQGPTGGGLETVDFPASAGFHASVQNLANPMPLANISFEGLGYTVTGNPIELYGASITQSAVGSDAISTNLVLGHQLTVSGSGNLGLSGQITPDSGDPSAGITYNGSGTLTLSGASSQFDNLQVSSGSVTFNGGSATISGLELPALNVGAASLLVEGAAVFNGPTTLYVGGTSVTHGNLTVTGVGSKWKFVNADGGVGGPGDFVVDAGATATGTGMILGITGSSSLLVQAGSTLSLSGVSQFGLSQSTTATVTGAGSTWTNSGSLQLGVDAAGALNVTDGGTVSLGSFTVGYDATGTVNINTDGSVTVAGTTAFTKGSLTVNAGTFTSALLQGSGASIAITNPALGTALTINGASGSDTFGGAITGTGSLLKSGGSTQTLTGSNSYGGGTSITGGTLVIGAAGALPSGSSITNSGAFIVKANSTAGNITGSGTTSIAAGITLSADNVIQDALTIDLSGASPAVHAKLVASGTLSLSQLNVTLTSGLAAAGTFDILDWSTLAGSFTVNLPILPANLSWNTSQLYTSGILTVTSTLPGDYNGNGAVDAADYVLWRESVGQSALPNRGSGITGPVGVADYNFWRAHFANTSGSGAGGLSNSAVPEPSSLLLLVVGMLGVLNTRRSKSK